MDVCVGDRVQIVNGGMDVTNGHRAKSGKMYGEGGPLWATVVLIDENWKTGSKFGLPATVTKVRCSNEGVVVWQVQPQDIAPNIIHASKPELVQTEPDPPEADPAPAPKEEKEEEVALGEPPIDNTPKLQRATASEVMYAPLAGSDTWVTGVGTMQADSIPYRPGISKTDEAAIIGSAFETTENVHFDGESNLGFTQLTDSERKVIGPQMDIDRDALISALTPTIIEDVDKKAELYADDIIHHQNAYGFPYTDGTMAPKSDGTARKYSFQIIPGDTHFPAMISLEDKLRDFRAAVGIPVHGSERYARAMKYFMYNRFKVPDTNLAHNRSTTHVFFSRPDLNILHGMQVAQQCLNHTEAALVWRRYPELFKLLVDAKRTGDHDNFNMLLSNQCTSFDIRDEDLNTVDAGKSWGEYSIPYGDSYTGRTSGEFSCNFTETSDYSVINLIKLWITYIDNVGRGAWSPSYMLVNESGINRSHVFTKTLDYAASAYVFKCGPHGEDVLYWTKYYGVYPINTGASALSWDADSPIGNTPKLNIRFKYAWKKDMSPISLLEFNNLAKITDVPVSENSFNVELGHSARPYVGTPFIEMYLGSPSLVSGGVNFETKKRTTIRLKFKPTDIQGMDDDSLYRSSMLGRGKQDYSRLLDAIKEERSEVLV